MKRMILAACAALSLTACDPAAIVSAPAPLGQTILDEKAITLAAQAVDAVAISASALVKVGLIKPGTPAALKLAAGLDLARDSVNAAEKARQAGSATNYVTAINRALAAVKDIKAIIATVGA